MGANYRKSNRRLILPMTAKKVRQFLEVLADGWTAHKAATETGIKYDRWNRERKSNPHFARRWERAEAAGVTTLEDAAQKRAVRGVLKPVVSQGRVVTFVREYSDSLLTSALKARSKRYAPSNPGDAAFEESFVGSAETLLAKLDDLFDRLDIKDPSGGHELCPVIKR